MIISKQQFCQQFWRYQFLSNTHENKVFVYGDKLCTVQKDLFGQLYTIHASFLNKIFKITYVRKMSMPIIETGILITHMYDSGLQKKSFNEYRIKSGETNPNCSDKYLKYTLILCKRNKDFSYCVRSKLITLVPMIHSGWKGQDK